MLTSRDWAHQYQNPALDWGQSLLRGTASSWTQTWCLVKLSEFVSTFPSILSSLYKQTHPVSLGRERSKPGSPGLTHGTDQRLTSIVRICSEGLRIRVWVFCFMYKSIKFNQQLKNVMFYIPKSWFKNAHCPNGFQLWLWVVTFCSWHSEFYLWMPW